jgi:hypothetical protein
MEQQPAAYYRTAAARAQRLQAEATTPRLKQYLGEEIARYERLAEEVETASGEALSASQRGSDTDHPVTTHTDPHHCVGPGTS